MTEYIAYEVAGGGFRFAYFSVRDLSALSLWSSGSQLPLFFSTTDLVNRGFYAADLDSPGNDIAEISLGNSRARDFDSYIMDYLW